MTLLPSDLPSHPDKLEAVEKATLRMVSQAIFEYAKQAQEIFANESDKPQDIAEDVTREALDAMGFSKIPVRLFGKIDFKRARYVFLPKYSLKQALFVDSKAEDVAAQHVARVQTSQTSMRIRQRRAGREIDEAGKLPVVAEARGEQYLTTTVFVKYNYTQAASGQLRLMSITVCCLPNGMLQDRYNPTPDDTIWIAGPNAPTRGEDFRARLQLSRLKSKAAWRVQSVVVAPEPAFCWTE